MKKLSVIFTVLTLILTATACKTSNTVTKQGFCFDTVINITVDKNNLSEAENAIAMCREFENTFSRTKKGSELYSLNSGETASPSAELLEVIEFSLDVSEKSDGAFDITVAPLCDLWNIKERTSPPEKEEIESVLTNVGYKKISLSPFSLSESRIDLGAVAKGYAADRIKSAFLEKGINSAIIDFGGNVVLIGEYTVGIRDPFNPDNLFASVVLKDKSAVTSGAYQRYFEYNGKRYHHIIDPRTGECADSGISSVTVICDSSMQADALSTAIYVLGAEGIELCEKFTDTDALLITDTGEIITTEGFEEKYKLKLFNN